MPVNASGAPELLLAADTGSTLYPSSWTPDGKALLYEKSFTDSATKTQIWILPATASGGDRQPRLLIQAAGRVSDARVSPDGKWVAYESAESGRQAVYVVPFAGPGAKTMISTQVGVEPRWARSGRELFFKQFGQAVPGLMVVDMATTPPGRPQQLFSIRSGYDVAPDAQRFLVARSPQAQTDRPVTTFIVITDWFEQLRRRAPVKK